MSVEENHTGTNEQIKPFLRFPVWQKPRTGATVITSKVDLPRLQNRTFQFHSANHSDKPLRAKIVSAMASTIFESYLHWTNMESGGIFFLLLLTFSEKTAALGSGCLGNVEFKHLCNWGFINGFCIGGVLCWEILRQWIACSLIFVNFIVWV